MRCTPDSLRIRYAGTTTLLFEDRQTHILVDGFFTRPPLWQWLTGPFQPDLERIRNALEALQIQHLDTLAVFHSHFDHVMDSPSVALLTGAEILGSESTAMVARGGGLPEARIQVASPGSRYLRGNFAITLAPGEHMSLGPLAQWLGLDGDILRPLVPPAHMLNYREGGTYSIFIEHPQGNSLLHGTRLTPAMAQWPGKWQTLFVTTPGLHRLTLSEREAYVQGLIAGRGVQRVVAVHWDDFSRPLSEPLQPFAPVLDPFLEDLAVLQQMLAPYPDISLELWPAFYQHCL
ncbi:MAG: MBL fold metallo-hydrolase [Candidatus Sericytochromatia bacterium]|nr:MBL fold metallo-hydrolase [Candidatus Sericytochromatia bacterium]